MTAPVSAVPVPARPGPLSVAPMMDRTDRHYRYFMRQITRRTLLYTEMITTAALLHGDPRRFLSYSQAESHWPCSWAARTRQLCPIARGWRRIGDTTK